MILLDTGPIVALFDPTNESHRPRTEILKGILEPHATTTPVLTEAFHPLSGAPSVAASRRSDVHPAPRKRTDELREWRP